MNEGEGNNINHNNHSNINNKVNNNISNKSQEMMPPRRKNIQVKKIEDSETER